MPPGERFEIGEDLLAVRAQVLASAKRILLMDGMELGGFDNATDASGNRLPLVCVVHG